MLIVIIKVMNTAVSLIKTSGPHEKKKRKKENFKSEIG